MDDISSGLAERKTKQKIGNDPNGIAWREHANDFAEKMMSKMGWTNGQGLGKELQGITEPVKNSLKQDKRGLGCSAKRALQGSVHTDDFDSILAKLNENHCRNVDEPATRAMNLTEKSQSTSSRLHYSKFVKSKDVSTYSSNELACIFAKSETSEPVKEVIVKSASVPDFGVKTTTSTVSLNDYFKMKMKNKITTNNDDDDDSRALISDMQENAPSCVLNKLSDSDYSTECSKPKKKKKSKKSKRLSSPDISTDQVSLNQLDNANDIVNSVSKSVNEVFDLQRDSGIEENSKNFDKDNRLLLKKKKSKKRKSDSLDPHSDYGTRPSNHVDQEGENLCKKKKKSKKLTTENDSLNPEIVTVADVSAEEYQQHDDVSVSKKVKKRKKKTSEPEVRIPTKSRKLSEPVSNSSDGKQMCCLMQIDPYTPEFNEPGLKVPEHLYNERQHSHGMHLFPSSNYFCIEGYAYY